MSPPRHSSQKVSVNEWIADRPWRIFIFCLPALLGVLAIAAVALIVFSRKNSDTQRRYDGLAQYALANRNYEEARVACLRGLAGAENDRDRARWLYVLASALNGLDQRQDAADLVAEAAPLDHPGYAPAHLLMAGKLLSNTNLTPENLRLAALNPTNDIAEILRQAERHLTNALTLEPDSLPVNETLGRFYINTRQPAKARELLLKVYAAKPEAALLLAINADLQNDGPAAQLWSDRAITALEQIIIDSAPNYNPLDRQSLVRALIIRDKYSALAAEPESLARTQAAFTNSAPQDSPIIWMGIVRLLVAKGKYDAALQTLDNLDRQAASATNYLYRRPIAEVCALWAGSLPLNQPDASALRFQLIEKGLTNAPQYLQLQLLLTQAAFATNDTAGPAKALLDERMATATGDAAAWWHFLIAWDAGNRGDLVERRQQLETAYQIAPNLPQVGNDLAMDMLSSTNRADWERGLKLIQTVLDHYPQETSYRDTRGQVLARLGRNQEALADLEYSVARLPKPEESRKVLAKVYAALGMVVPEVAPDQLERVRELESENKYADALATLDQAMLVNSNQTYAAAEAELCATWVESLPLSQHAERLQLIQKGLRRAPQDPKLQALLLQATQSANVSAPAAKEFLDQMVAGAVGDSAAQWHLFLGRDARQRGDLTAARKHLQAAYALTPGNTEIQIELAIVLSAGNPDDLARALELIQPALDQFPDNAGFRNTRGRILARLGRNAEAAPDLEFAAPRLTNPADSAQARLLLAKVYDALGKTKAADEQRRLAGAPGTP